MATDLEDTQTGVASWANTSAEEIVYGWSVPANFINQATLYRITMGGSISTRAALPGNLTVRLKCAGFTATIASEAMLASLSASNFASNFDCILFPDGRIALNGLVVQNASDIFTSAGPRIGSTGGAGVDLTIEQTIMVTIQFSTADTGNVFIRKLVTMLESNAS